MKKLIVILFTALLVLTGCSQPKDTVMVCTTDAVDGFKLEFEATGTDKELSSLLLRGISEAPEYVNMSDSEIKEAEQKLLEELPDMGLVGVTDKYIIPNDGTIVMETILNIDELEELPMEFQMTGLSSPDALRKYGQKQLRADFEAKGFSCSIKDQD